MQKFEAHGHYDLSVSRNIIHLKASGEWNKEIAEQLFAEINELVDKLDGNVFAKLIDAREWQLGTHEFTYLAKESIDELVQRGLRREAYIVDEGHTKQYQILLMTPKANGYERRLFRHESHALCWLNEEGFK
jgi:hypothetical protein